MAVKKVIDDGGGGGGGGGVEWGGLTPAGAAPLPGCCDYRGAGGGGDGVGGGGQGEHGCIGATGRQQRAGRLVTLQDHSVAPDLGLQGGDLLHQGLVGPLQTLVLLIGGERGNKSQGGGRSKGTG